jgi:hypothetical protein
VGDRLVDILLRKIPKNNRAGVHAWLDPPSRRRRPSK